MDYQEYAKPESEEWYEELVRESLEPDEIIDHIFRFFGKDQALDFYQDLATDWELA